MPNEFNDQIIYFVDDEPRVVQAVSQTLQELGCEVTCFSNAVDCLDTFRYRNCSLLITDINMPGMDGLELLAKVRKIQPLLSVLVITGYGDIPMAVRAVKAGAVDFIEKPFAETAFLATVQTILRKNISSEQLLSELLTKGELIVLRLLVAGKSNKEVAFILKRSVRTIENHRRRLMHKLNAGNAVELAKAALTMGLGSSPQTE